MKKDFKKPSIKKVELKPDEAVLAGCKQKKICKKGSKNPGS